MLCGAQERAATAAGHHRPRRHGDRLCQWRLWLRRDVRHLARGSQSGAGPGAGVGTRYGRVEPLRHAHAGASGGDGLVPFAVDRFARGLASRLVRASRCRVASRRDRSADRRLGNGGGGAQRDPPAGHQRRWRRRAALSLPVRDRISHRACQRRYADAHAGRAAQHLPAGRGRGARALRLRRRRTTGRRGGAARSCSRRIARAARWTCCSRRIR